MERESGVGGRRKAKRGSQRSEWRREEVRSDADEPHDLTRLRDCQLPICPRLHKYAGGVISFRWEQRNLLY